MTEIDMIYKFDTLYNYLKFYRCFPEIVGAVSQQFPIVDAVSQRTENVASMRPQFGVLDAVRLTQVSHLLAYRGEIVPRDRTAKANLFGTEEQIKENSRR